MCDNIIIGTNKCVKDKLQSPNKTRNEERTQRSAELEEFCRKNATDYTDAMGNEQVGAMEYCYGDQVQKKIVALDQPTL